jgi:hypothetical protein
MKPAPFDYHRPVSLAETFGFLEESDFAAGTRQVGIGHPLGDARDRPLALAAGD